MSRKRVPSSADSTSTKGLTSLKGMDDISPSWERFQFVGLALGGGKTEKTCVSVIEYFPQGKKVFLRHLFEKVGGDKDSTADEKLMSILNQLDGETKSVAVNAPIQLPMCPRCRLSCPGVEKCRQKEVAWLREKYATLNKKKRPQRAVTPYTERCVDFVLTHEFEEKFSSGHGLGANLAPLAARMVFLMKQIKWPVLEVFPRASLWRIGRALNVPKTTLRFHKHSVDGVDSREQILNRLIEKNVAFLYVQDVRIMIENGQAFDSFICALTGLLKYRKQCVARPKGLPRSSTWVEVPVENIEW